MEEQIKNLLEKYEKHIQWLRTLKDNDKEKLHALIRLTAFKEVIQDLKEITDKPRHENRS